MEQKLESLKGRPVGELLEEQDLENVMNMAVVLYGKQVDLVRLRILVDEASELNRVYCTICWEMLRIVRLKEWEEFQKWKKTKTKP